MSIMSVHPAMLNKFRNKIAKVDEDDLNNLLGWESFTPDEKKFLAVFGWFGEKKSAAEYIGKSAQWVDRHQRKNPLFKEAVNSRDDMQVRIARKFGADLIGKAVLRLDAMLDEDGADKRTQLNAIQTVLRMNHMDGKEEEPDDAALQLLKQWRQYQAPQITVTNIPGQYEKPQAMK